MASLTLINEFLNLPVIAVAGVSQNKKRFGWSVFDQLTKGGRKVYAINPKYSNVNGLQCFSSLSELPEKVDGLVVLTSPANSVKAVQDAVNNDVGYLWLQQMSDSPESLMLAKENKMKLIEKECIFMFAGEVKSIHRFHRGLWKIIGKYPKA